MLLTVLNIINEGILLAQAGTVEIIELVSSVFYSLPFGWLSKSMLLTIVRTSQYINVFFGILIQLTVDCDLRPPSVLCVCIELFLIDCFPR